MDTGKYTLWSATWENVPPDMYTLQRLKSASDSAQSDQSLYYRHEESLHPWLSDMRPVKILRECAVWSESSLGAHTDVEAYFISTNVLPKSEFSACEEK